MNPSEIFDVYENPASIVHSNVQMLEGRVDRIYHSTEEIRMNLEETASPARLDVAGSDEQIIQNHIGLITQAIAQILDSWIALPKEGEPEDRKDFIEGLQGVWHILAGYFTEGVFNTHDINNRINILMHYEVFEVADKMKEDSKALLKALKLLAQLDLPLNTDIFYPIPDLPEGTRVLVIEDLQKVIDLVKYQVGDRGTVVSAITPDQLPEEGEFDLILLDWFWGKEIGGDYLELLKQRFPSAVILGHSSSSNRQKYFGETPACNKGAWFDIYMTERAKIA